MRGLKGGDIRLSKVGEAKHLTVAAFEPVIFIGRDHHRALAAVTGDGDRLCQRHILISADVALKLTGGNADRLAGDV